MVSIWHFIRIFCVRVYYKPPSYEKLKQRFDKIFSCRRKINVKNANHWKHTKLISTISYNTLRLNKRPKKGKRAHQKSLFIEMYLWEVYVWEVYLFIIAKMWMWNPWIYQCACKHRNERVSLFTALKPDAGWHLHILETGRHPSRGSRKTQGFRWLPPYAVG